MVWWEGGESDAKNYSRSTGVVRGSCACVLLVWGAGDAWRGLGAGAGRFCCGCGCVCLCGLRNVIQRSVILETDWVCSKMTSPVP